jgi:hypothetical protein
MEGTIMDTRILEQLEESFAQEIALAGNELGSLDVLLKEKLQLLGSGLLQRLVNRGANGYEGALPAAPCRLHLPATRYPHRDQNPLF